MGGNHEHDDMDVVIGMKSVLPHWQTVDEDRYKSNQTLSKYTKIEL